MPIFDHRSLELRRRLDDGSDSVVARWLGTDALDAWWINEQHRAAEGRVTLAVRSR